VSRVAWLFVVGSIALAIACAIPGRLYPVSPALSGQLHGGDIPSDGAQLVLHVVHSESADLHSKEQVPLAPQGRFAFEAVELAVAGHEYSKNYRIFLHYLAGGKNRVIWRAQFSRLALTATAVELDCDLDRPVRHGQPCWVRDPLQHPWIVWEGERTYRRNCQRCHGLDGRGVIGTDDVAESQPPDLSEIAARRGGRFDRAEVSEWIDGRSVPASHGTRSMPIWGELMSVEYERYADGEALVGAVLDPLVSYLESLQRKD
jgi:mono/diheme cytochrome c family protein